MDRTTRQPTSLRTRASLAALMLLGLAFLCLTPGSSVWATPRQSPLRQTIPTLTPTPVPSWIWVGLPTGNPVDYAPWGVPDFDQQQEDWHAPAEASNWTHSAPVALADVLWWLDSRFEPGRTPPPAVSDAYPLIQPLDGLDDHDPGRIVSLVTDLAGRLDTNGVRTHNPHLGTDLSTLLPVLRGYLGAVRLEFAYTLTLVPSPSIEQLLLWAQGADGVVLYLGLWEDQGAGKWVYQGGHYVALAGADPLNHMLAISDPRRDAFEQGETLGRSPASHLHVAPHGTDVHNDAQYVSQDAYRAVASTGPDQALALESYTASDGWIGQNFASEFQRYADVYSGAGLQAKVDYALVLSRQTMVYLSVILKLAR